MIAVDTNVLVHAHRGESPWHDAALAALSQLGTARWAIPWPCVHEFLAIATHPKIFSPPTPLEKALRAARVWHESPTVVLLGETDEHFNTLDELVTRGRVVGPRVHDARIAAICLQHGVTKLGSADRDFSRFPALKVENPLVR